MPLQLKPQVYETYFLDEIDAKYGVSGEEATSVTIKLASQAEHEQRQKFFARMERKFAPDDNPDEFTIVQELSNDELKRHEAWFTLVECNITDENGNPLFKSGKNKSGDPVLQMSRDGFTKAWGRLPHDVADAIHKRVLELNIQWAGLEGEGL